MIIAAYHQIYLQSVILNKVDQLNLDYVILSNCLSDMVNDHSKFHYVLLFSKLSQVKFNPSKLGCLFSINVKTLKV